MTLPRFDESLKFPAYCDFANAKLEAIEGCNWFSSVGQKKIKRVDRVETWEEALQLAVPEESGDFSFGDYVQDLVNDTRMFAASKDRERYNKIWGKAHTAVGKKFTSFFKKQVLSKIPIKPLSPYVTSGITSIQQQVILALAYGESFAPLDEHVGYFLDGHFPCGYGCSSILRIRNSGFTLGFEWIGVELQIWKTWVRESNSIP
jgi:hypothetical protein